MGIEKLEKISCKSFDNFTLDEPLSKVNIFFGTNGSGKSALSQWIQSSRSMGVKIFNTEYVSDNILAKDEISGVKLTVGEDAINVEDMIETIDTANGNIHKLIEKSNSHINEQKNRAFDILNTTLQQGKNQFSLNNNINQKANAKNNPKEAYNRWLDDIDESEKSDVGSSIELEQKKEILNNKLTTLSLIPIIDDLLVHDVFSKLSKIVLPPNNHVSKNLGEWLKEGYLFHNMDGEHATCQFCSNEFNSEVVKTRIEKRLNTEHAKYVSQLEEMLVNIKEAKRIIENISSQELSNYLEIAVELIDIIESKIKNTNVIQDETRIKYDQLLEVNGWIAKEQKDLFSQKKEIENKLLKIETVAKSWIGKQLKANENIQLIFKDIERLENSIYQHESILKQNEEWILEQQQLNSDLQPFRDLVNEQFSVLGVDFELEIMSEGAHYSIRHKMSRTPIMTKDLSEGERRLLGFLHFYYDLFDKPHESFMSDIEIIIIDDPITSLDSDNRYYLTELINKFIKKGIVLEKQLFVFTHSSLDFHNFGYSLSKGISFWKICKNPQGNSEIYKVAPEERRNYSNYYQTNFNSVFQFAILNKKGLSQSNFIHYGNKARIVLESHARANYQIEYATNQSYKSLSEVYEIEKESEDQFRRMLDVINSLSHGMSFIDENNISSIEVQKNVRYLLSVLYRKDRHHVENMAKPLISRGNKKDVMMWLNPEKG